MTDIALKPCSWGCTTSAKVHGDDQVICGTCQARGPSADKMSRLHFRKGYGTYSMANAVARALWNLRGVKIADRVQELVTLSHSCGSAEEFKRRYVEMTGPDKASKWLVALRSYKTLTEGVEYQIKAMPTVDGKRMLVALDADDAEVLCPEDVFMLVLA